MFSYEFGSRYMPTTGNYLAVVDLESLRLGFDWVGNLDQNTHHVTQIYQDPSISQHTCQCRQLQCIHSPLKQQECVARE